MNMQSIMAQAQKMQRDLQQKKDELNQQLFPGKSDWVEVVFNGKKEIVSLKITYDGSIGEDDREMLEDMIVVAINNAMKKVDEITEQKMGKFGNMSGLI